MKFGNEIYLGLEDEHYHAIKFERDSNVYIAKVQYDRFRNVQILDIVDLKENVEVQKYFNDVDVDYLECFLFKELLDSIA